MIKIDKLTKHYGDQTVVNELSLSIPRGTVFGFLGPNGAGKTTSMKIFVGINHPDSGLVSINGNSPAKSLERQEIGYMPEEPYFYDQLTGLEFMKFVNNLFDSRKRSSADRIEDILRRTGIYEARDKKIRTYSKGMRQRLGFAQALINDPEYIFLDEPLEGLDPIGRREMKLMLINLKNSGKTIFFNSHILADVENICDMVGVIHKGRLLYTGPVNEFRKDMSLEERFVEIIKSQK